MSAPDYTAAQTSWIAQHPQWYRSERSQMARLYPGFWVDEARLAAGQLAYYGELAVRPPKGTVRYPVALYYPQATPFEPPVVKPLMALPPQPDDATSDAPTHDEPRFFDYRHQMRNGVLCSFQRETRAPGGDIIRGIDALRRAERWFLGLHTGHWPPDSADSELESHFALGTSVLLGSAFYDSLPLDAERMSGEFFLVPDFRRAFESALPQVCPYIATAFTADINGVLRILDARADLARLYPWIRDEAWDPNATATKIELTPAQQAHDIERGGWWYLPREPRPFRDGAGFLRELAAGLFGNLAEAAGLVAAWNEVNAKLRGSLTVETNNFLAFCYPGRHGRLDWLMVVIARPDNARKEGTGIMIASEAQKREAFSRAPVHLLRTHSVRPAELGLRNRGVVSQSIADTTVALIGLGALGAKVAELLAQAGVLSFRLCDLDAMTPGNAARHIAGISSFGAAKVTAVMRRLLDINPHIRFEPGSLWPGSATSSIEDLRSFIAPADLVIATTADEAAESFLNEVAITHGTPVLYGRALRRGSVGRIFLVRPGTDDACKACLAQYARRSQSGEATPTDWIDVTESPDDAVLHECGRPVIPASAVDLSLVAGLTARIALGILERAQEPEGSPASVPNHWLWTRDAAPDLDARLAMPLSTFIGSIPRDPLCPVCQPAEITEVQVTAEANAAIIRLTEESPNQETGGILIGYIEPGTPHAVVLRATEPGPGAVRTPTRFERDIAFAQQELDRAERELGVRGGYIGEWHSHLVAQPIPSPTDIESLTGIAEADNYETRYPVMIIAGFDTAARKVTTLQSWVFPQNTGMKRIELSVSPNVSDHLVD